MVQYFNGSLVKVPSVHRRGRRTEAKVNAVTRAWRPKEPDRFQLVITMVRCNAHIAEAV